LGKGIAGSVVSSPVERHLEEPFDNQSVPSHQPKRRFEHFGVSY